MSILVGTSKFHEKVLLKLTAFVTVANFIV